jgi:diaminopropionate ammonia-lyase
MSTYKVRHLSTGQEYTRPWILLNPNITPSPSQPAPAPNPDIEAFHKKLPDYNTTPLHNLPSIAAELGIPHLFLKDESTRFSLPAFKILGASWAIHKLLCQRFSLPVGSSLEAVRGHASKHDGLRLVTCSEGNWGRAVARMGRILSVEVRVYVPGFMSAFTRELLRGEGAEVVVLEGGSYDDAITATREAAERDAGVLMVMDTSWEGYEEVPKVCPCRLTNRESLPLMVSVML